jgi:hypothetical protein
MLSPRRTHVLNAKREPLIEADELARANREWEVNHAKTIAGGVPAPPNFRVGMPVEEIWAWHRSQETKIVGEIR